MAEKKIYIPFKKRTKRQQLITPTASLQSLFSGSSASINATSSQTASDSNRSSKKYKMGRKNDKDKIPKTERWLLTRKTWKYMADAGRRLIPDYIQNRGNTNDPQDLKKIEEYFQHVCGGESRFLPIFRRKQSFPGALGITGLRQGDKLRHSHKWLGRSTNRLAPISDVSNIHGTQNRKKNTNNIAENQEKHALKPP